MNTKRIEKYLSSISGLKDLETSVLKSGMQQDLSTAIQLEMIHFNRLIKLMSGFMRSLKSQKNRSRETLKITD